MEGKIWTQERRQYIQLIKWFETISDSSLSKTL